MRGMKILPPSQMTEVELIREARETEIAYRELPSPENGSQALAMVRMMGRLVDLRDELERRCTTACV